MFKSGIIIYVTVFLLLQEKVTPAPALDQLTYPYEECSPYKIGGKKGYPLTHDNPLRDGSILAFYPLTDDNTMLYIHLMFTEFLFKVKVEGTLVTLLKCNRFGRNCEIEAKGGVKSSNFIKPKMWNFVRIDIKPNQILMYIGARMVKSMRTTTTIDTERAYWGVIVKDEPNKNYNPNEPDYLYVVQFKCDKQLAKESPETHQPVTVVPNPDGPKETTRSIFRLNTHEIHNPGNKDEFTFAPTYNTVTPAPHIAVEGDPKAKPEEEAQVGLIVGIVVAIIILLAAIIVLYNVLRKKYSANITENSPLQKQQQTAQ